VLPCSSVPSSAMVDRMKLAALLALLSGAVDKPLEGLNSPAAAFEDPLEAGDLLTALLQEVRSSEAATRLSLPVH